MKYIHLNSDTESTYQSFEDVIPIDGQQRRVRFELRLLGKVNKWYLSMFDSETGESYFRYVPMVACINDVNDLIAPFRYKGTGFVLCASLVEEPSSVSPEKGNLGQFGIVWGEGNV